MVNPDDVIDIFKQHSERDKQFITRAMFEKNLHEKRQNHDFSSDMTTLIHPRVDYDFDHAMLTVHDKLITRLQGEAWVGVNSENTAIK